MLVLVRTMPYPPATMPCPYWHPIALPYPYLVSGHNGLRYAVLGDYAAFVIRERKKRRFLSCPKWTYLVI